MNSRAGAIIPLIPRHIGIPLDLHMTALRGQSGDRSALVNEFYLFSFKEEM